MAIRSQSLRALNEPLSDLGVERKEAALVFSHEAIHQRSLYSDEITEFAWA